MCFKCLDQYDIILFAEAWLHSNKMSFSAGIFILLSLTNPTLSLSRSALMIRAPTKLARPLGAGLKQLTRSHHPAHIVLSGF